jgi:hypothetical protein
MLLATGVAGAALGAWLVLVVQLAGGERAARNELLALTRAASAPSMPGADDEATAAERELRAGLAALAVTRQRLVAAAAAVAVALLLAGGLARRLSRSALDPAPRPLGLDGGAPFASSPELVRVGTSFGRMVDELERRHQEAARHRDELEAELLERTRELALAREAAERTVAPRSRIERGSELPPALSSRRGS